MFGTIVTIGLCLYGIIALILVSIVNYKRSDYMNLIKAYYNIVNALNDYDLTKEQREKLENALFEITHILNDLESEGKYFDNYTFK
jgi:CRISPR/Cas system-associated exonuclease Cas4 (RecB family)